LRLISRQLANSSKNRALLSPPLRFFAPSLRPLSFLTMKAIRVRETGDAGVLRVEEKLPLPDVKDHEIRVKLEASGVNFIDVYHRNGLYTMPLPFIPGREGAGVITEVGSNAAKEFKVGDRVAVLNEGPAGSYAEYANVPWQKAVKIPDQVATKLAAAVLLQGLTAHYLVSSTYPVKPSDTILVHAGAGGTGGLVVEMAKIKGATVIATVSSPEKAAVVKQLGANHTIDYTKQNFLEEVKRITNGKGVQCVYDGVGAATWENSLKCLARRGFLVLFGNASGPVPPIAPLELTKQGSVYLTRPTMHDYLADRSEFLDRCRDVFEWVQSGKIHVRIAKEFPLERAAEAHAFLTSRAAAGKVLLLP